MAFYLRCHFDPDFDHTRLTPHEGEGGDVDHYELGYVQNVVKDQVLAEIVPLEEHTAAHGGEPEARFVLQEPHLPAGKNVLPHPENPRQLIAAVTGYVFFHEGLIHVHNVLNVRRDVDFHTGNISFVGDLVVHGGVRSGFSIKGRNVRVMGPIGGAEVTAQGFLLAEGGVKGQKKATLTAGQDIRCAFCENARLTARRHVRVESSSLHCVIYAGMKVLVGGRLQGGETVAGESVAVGEQLGGGVGTVTRVLVGKNPNAVRAVERIEMELEELEERIAYYAERMQHGAASVREFSPKKEAAERKRQLLKEKRLQKLGEVDQHGPGKARILVAGVVKPGLEARLGDASCYIDETLGPTRFTLNDEGEVALGPYTGIKK